MFSFLFSRAAEPEPEPDAIAQLQTRRVFSYYDGQRQRWVDPLAIHDTIRRNCDDIDRLLLDVRGGDDVDREIAVHQLVTLTRTVFGVEQFSDEAGHPAGLTRAETIGLLTQFIVFMGTFPEVATSRSAT